MSNSLRITGMASGLDVDTIVKQMMKSENAKMDKLVQNRQKTIWKQDAYRDILSDITNLKSTYLDVLKPETYMLSSSNYSSFDVANSDSTTTSIATAIAGAGANVGIYNLKNIEMATYATASGEVQTSKVASANVSFPVKNADLVANNYNELTFNLNGDLKDYKIALTTDYTNLDSMVNDINNKLKSAQVNSTTEDISSKVKASLSADGMSIVFNQVDTNVLNGIKKSDTNPLAGNKMDFGINIEAGLNDALSVSINGVTTNITLDSGKYTLTNGADGIINQINAKLTVAGISTLKAELSLDGTRIKFTSTDPLKQFSIKGKATDALGFSSSSTDIYPSVYDRMSSLFSNDVDANVDFTINGKNFKFDFSSTGADKNKSINEVIKQLSSEANCNITYSELTRKFTIESKTTGEDQTLTASQTSGKFLDVLFNAASIDKKGTNSQVTITDPKANTEITVYKTANTFTIDGMTYNLLKNDNSPGGINIGVSSNVQKSVDKLKSFLEKYNEIVGKINSKLTEKVERDYLPLTDEQKKGMSDDDIKLWEEKAKKGALRNDSNLQKMLYSLRSAFFDQIGTTGVDKLNASMSSLGLSTSSDYLSGGKIVIQDETKLKAFIQNNPKDYMDFFTKKSSIDYDVNHLSDNGRYQSEGVLNRIDDILKDYTRTTRDNQGNKGLLINIAGIAGDSSEITNTLYKDITDNYDKKIKELAKKLATKETYYYNQFSKLETAMQKLNSQQNWFTQQLNGGK